MREKSFLLRIRRLLMSNAEKVPLPILGANERVVVDVPPVLFSHRRIINLVKFTHAKRRLGCARAGASNRRLTRFRLNCHQSQRRGESR
jgi:hypothetical protein